MMLGDRCADFILGSAAIGNASAVSTGNKERASACSVLARTLSHGPR